MERRLPPCQQQMKPLLTFAGCSCTLGMHIEAIGASVDLRTRGFDQLQRRMLEPATADTRQQIEQGLDFTLPVSGAFDQTQ